MFEGILNWLYSWVGNYGVAVILFTLLVRLVLFPFDYKSRKSMRKISQLQPKLAALQKKYGNDREKLNKKTQELYQKEHANPLSGCLPMLLSYPILIIMFNAMRNVANQAAVGQALQILQNPGISYEELNRLDFLWIKNLVMADSPLAGSMINLSSLIQAGPDVWQKVLAEIPDWAAQPWATQLGLTAESFAQENLQATCGSIIRWLGANSAVYVEYNQSSTLNLMAIFPVTYFTHPNGWFLLPILSAASQFIMTKITGNQQPSASDDPSQAASQATGKFMKWFFPIFSLWICSTSTAAFALYWVASNLIAMGSTVALNKYLDSKDKKDTIAGEGVVQ